MKITVSWLPWYPGWDYDYCNIGLVTGAFNGVVVVDCDSFESYTGWLKNRPSTPLRVKSKRGMHFYYRHPGDSYVKSDSHIEAKEGFVYDVKGDKSYVMLPPSLRHGHQYQFCVCSGNIRGGFINPQKLPMFDMAWRPERSGGTINGSSQEIRDIHAYISHITAGEGQRDRETYRVCRLLMESGIGEAEAVVTVIDWHKTNCTPPWDNMQIWSKVRKVYGES